MKVLCRVRIVCRVLFPVLPVCHFFYVLQALWFCLFPAVFGRQALQAFALPRSLGKREGEEVSASTGRFGPYVKYKSLFVSIKRDSGLDPFSISLDEAIPMIEAKIPLEANKNINVFAYGGEEIQILN